MGAGILMECNNPSTTRKLLQQTFINSASVNTEELSKGIYFYEIKNKNSLVEKGKLVKE
ncbi:MAG: T9SS type A sorting domain-containing protein [Bacteroidota bacterium]